jgi:hypothetical protein
MNSVHFCTVERRNFGDLLSAEGKYRLKVQSVRDLASVLQLRPGDKTVTAVWSQDPRQSTQLPEMLICQDGTSSDWAAWITTFGAKVRPFSAFTRLIERTAAQNLATSARTPVLNGLTWPITGLILGEVLAASRLPDRSLDSLAANACESTLSFAMFRAACLYSRFQEWGALVHSWEFVRKVTRQQPRTVESSAVARVCAAIIDAASLSDDGLLAGSGDVNVLRVCREIISSPESIPQSLSLIPQFTSIAERMFGPREERVVAFNEFVRNLNRPPSDYDELTSFMLGYLASRIAPGTMQHSGVLAPIAHRYKTALLWYGFCAGFGGTDLSARNLLSSQRSTPDLPVSERRVARDLLRPESLLAYPTCDLAFEELLVLSRTGGDPLSGLIRTSQGSAIVDLVPGVSTVVNVSSKGPEAPMRTERERDLIVAMGEHINRLRDLYRDLAGTDTLDGQRSLLPPKRKKP